MKKDHTCITQKSRCLLSKPQCRAFPPTIRKRLFREEIFPYLQPVPVSKDKVISFLRDNRLYLAVRLFLKGTNKEDADHLQYFVMKLPYSKVPRFIELPKHGRDYYLMFIEDIIKANIDVISPDTK